MLEIFGNVFGKSKKQVSGQSGQSGQSGGNNNTNQESENSDGFIVLGQTNGEQQSAMLTANEEPPPLYPTTILTNDMLRMGVSEQSTRGESSSRSSNQNYERSYSTPIDNVPFTTTTTYTGNESTNINNEIKKCFETIDRIQQYLSNPSQSEYNFNLENSILSESLLS